MHLKKNGKLPSGESIENIVNKYRNENWLGIICACVSLEIIESATIEMNKLKISFGFKANLWKREEPTPVHSFNTAKYNEIGKNPNIVLGKREDITGKIFYDFSKKVMEKGATILGGCCETNPEHINAISKLKY